MQSQEKLEPNLCEGKGFVTITEQFSLTTSYRGIVGETGSDGAARE